MQMIDGVVQWKSELVRSHGSPIILTRLRNARAGFNGEKIALESVDKWVATIATVNALVRRKLYV
jgi:hypothetical protein